MKNTIPMIIAVVLAAAAVFAVSRMIRSKDDGDTRRYVEVVSAAQNIPAGKEGIKEDWLTKRRVEVSSMPAKTVPWSQANRLVGQSEFVPNQIKRRSSGIWRSLSRKIPSNVRRRSRREFNN